MEGFSGRLARTIAARATPADALALRLDIAFDVAAQLARQEPLVAALVVGSTALGRSSPLADLDLVLITAAPPTAPTFETRTAGGLQVEIERITQDEALRICAGKGWIWELRNAARLGCGRPVLDPAGFAAVLERRAAALRPKPSLVQATLRDVYAMLADLGSSDGTSMLRAEALRGCVDSLTVLTLLDHPRRYQKAKWVLADLIHAGEASFVGLLLAAYGLVREDPAAARKALLTARILIEAAHAARGAPSHDALLAMGYAPDFVEESYVSRCLADAAELASAERWIEAHYVARFAARLAAAEGSLEGAPSLLGGLAARDAALAELYCRLDEDAGAIDVGGLLAVALDTADERLQSLATPATANEQWSAA
jgi:hypothetical protein